MTPIDPVTVVMLGGWRMWAVIALVLVALVCVAFGAGWLFHAWLMAGGGR